MFCSAVAGSVGFLSSPALAHVTVSPEEAQEDGYQKLTFRVPHGCDGSPTTSITVQIPAGVGSVVPQEVAGWTIETQEGPLPEPVETHGEKQTTGVTSVTWTGGPLPDHHMQEFGMSVYLAGDAGETLYFPVVQRCSSGEARWIQIPQSDSAEELPYPAPAVKLTAKEESGHGGGSAGGAESPDGEKPAESASSEEMEAALASVRSELDSLAKDVDAVREEVGSASDEGDAADPLSAIALAVGALGLITGGSALVMSRRR